MRTWKEIIKEATAAEIRRAGEAALRDERMKNRKISADEKAKKRQEYIDLAKQREDRKTAYFDWVKSNAEQNKKDRIEKLRQSGVQQNVDKAKASISGIKTQQISDKDKDATAYSKAIGNVGSAAAGVGGAVAYGVKAALAKRKADAARKAEAQTPDKPNIPEKKLRKGGILGGRPPAPKPATPGTGASSSVSTPKPTTPTAPATRPFGPSGPTGPAAMKPKGPTGPTGPAAMKPKGPTGPTGPAAMKPKGPTGPTGPAAMKPKGPKGPKGPGGMRTEEYSNWREEFLYEVDTEKTNTKGKKKDIVDVMKGKNKIDLNPNEGQVKESIEKEPIEKENTGMDVKKKQQLTQQIALQKKIQMAKLTQLNKGIPLESYEFEGNIIDEEGPVLSVGRGEKLSVERGGGLTQKGRDKYNRATGSNLQAPVTGDVKPGSKAAQRRKNFCSRSRSWKGERGLAARRRWKC
jgi:hypothetical protein